MKWIILFTKHDLFTKCCMMGWEKTHPEKKKKLKQKTVFSQSFVVIYKAFYLDVAQGHMKGAPNETRTHSCGFASRAC